jgi:phage terminase large subunit GpA-like protein
VTTGASPAVDAPTFDTSGLAAPTDLYRDARRLYAPRAYVPPVEWIEDYFLVTADSGAALPGPYRFSRVPWWREVVNVLADDDTQRVVVAKSSQVGYSEMLLAWLAYSAVNDPSSTLMIQPTVNMAEDFSKSRIDPAIRDVPAFGEVVRSRTKGMARSADDTILRKAFAGGYLALGGANSPAGLASRPVRRVVGDELDRWPPSAGNEGSPLELARKRTITFWNRKIVAGGTPVAEAPRPRGRCGSRATSATGWCPCPHCNDRIRFRWRDDDGRVPLPVRARRAGRGDPDSVQYRCEACACLIEERTSRRWWPRACGRRRTRDAARAGYHIWSAYSSFGTWGELCDDFVKAHGVENDLKVFVNTMLGLPFAPKADKLGPVEAPGARGGLPASRPVPPPEVRALTAAVDVQGDRLE